MQEQKKSLELLEGVTQASKSGSGLVSLAEFEYVRSRNSRRFLSASCLSPTSSVLCTYAHKSHYSHVEARYKTDYRDQ